MTVLINGNSLFTANTIFRVHSNFNILSKRFSTRFVSTLPTENEVKSTLSDQSQINSAVTPSKHISLAPEPPLKRYNRLVKLGKLKNDPHQRAIIGSLGHLYDDLLKYNPPKLKMPNAVDQLPSFWTKILHPFKYKSINQDGPPLVYDDSVPKGIYLYGDVGCGKTMLMDLFYETIPERLSKKRMHFHQFMQYVHRRRHEIIVEQNLNELGEAKSHTFDPIPFLCYELASESRILCFDEFQVTDVADAMILRRLISELLSVKYGVVLFATSNREPKDLYINGIQRELFIPCIKLLEQRTVVTLLNSPTDYRKIRKPISSVYYVPPPGMKYESIECKANRDSHVKLWYTYFSQSEHPVIATSVDVSVWGRKLHVPKCTPPHVAQFTFKELCEGMLAAGDYLKLASQFRAFIITDIPFLSVYVRDEVRRFITFLDALYDSNGKLATTSAAKFTDLFVEPEAILNDFELKPDYKAKTIDDTDLENDVLVKKHGFSKEIASKAGIFALDEEKFAFARALSRLSQMSTTEWVEK
ncbi:related to Protein AFG1 [Saccharomycodes ludwigii]|uniref:Related to Protein AFG1 n=1 Tax=Saccharomycodes ludwigii TaxID=36035 RepID=A0A376B5V3_9ASCO|nr:related to Protein AFG1 [Saccharomycodes ludwigii]